MSGSEMPRRKPSVHRVDELLNDLQAHARAIRESWHAGETARLKTLAGRLASLAEGSGDRAVAEMAAEMEAVLLAEEAESSALCERIEELIRQCRRIQPG